MRIYDWKIHNKKKRMPVILPKKLENFWIDNTLTKEQAQKVLVPFDQDKMEAYTISRLITSKTQNPNVPEVMNPYKYPELEESNLAQSSLF